MKKLVIALSISAIALTGMSTSSFAAEKKKADKPSAEFFKNMQHASFMPHLLKHAKKYKTKFEIDKKQMEAIQAYHKRTLPVMQKMVAKLIELEKQAKEMTLDNYPPKAVAHVGEQTLKVRHDLMMAKIQCRSFLKSVLKPEQYKKVLTSYK